MKKTLLNSSKLLENIEQAVDSEKTTVFAVSANVVGEEGWPVTHFVVVLTNENAEDPILQAISKVQSWQHAAMSKEDFGQPEEA